MPADIPDKDGLYVLEEVYFDSLPTRVIVPTAAEVGKYSGAK
jgi:hypothetical protein